MLRVALPTVRFAARKVAALLTVCLSVSCAVERGGVWGVPQGTRDGAPEIDSSLGDGSVETDTAVPDDDDAAVSAVDSGTADSSAECVPGASCGTDVGECTPGRMRCDGNHLVCSGTGPSTEVCDGKDNDCDGSTDEGLARYRDQDADGHGDANRLVCSGGVSTRDDCNDESDSVFAGAPEVCGNAIDENCDGRAPACPASDCREIVNQVRVGPTTRHQQTYWLCETRRSFDAAVATCATLSPERRSKLVRAAEDGETLWITRALTTANFSGYPVWIGLRRNDWVWHWLETSSLMGGDIRWAPDEPMEGDGGCGALRADGRWQSDDCIRQLPAICEVIEPL